MKPTRQTCSTAYRDQNPRTRPLMEAACATTRDNSSWNSHTCCRRFLTLSSDLNHMRCQDSRVVPQSTWPENLVIIRRHTRQHTLPRYLSRHHVLVHAFTCLPRTERLLLMSFDVIRWRHHSTSAYHACRRPRYRPRKSILYRRLYWFGQRYDIFWVLVNTGVPFRIYRYFYYFIQCTKL